MYTMSFLARTVHHTSGRAALCLICFTIIPLRQKLHLWREALTTAEAALTAPLGILQ